MLFQSANLYMYIQAMFTEKYLHWCRLTVHNYPYLEWHEKLTVTSHINNVSDPSYYKVDWLEYCG